eukprot:5659683-Pleurochrysis_carterae.AAC.1
MSEDLLDTLASNTLKLPAAFTAPLTAHEKTALMAPESSGDDEYADRSFPSASCSDFAKPPSNLKVDKRG